MIPSTQNPDFQNFLSNPLTSLTETQKREKSSLWYLSGLSFLPWVAWAVIFLCVLSLCWLRWPFPWGLYFDHSKLEQLGFHNCWIPQNSRRHTILLKRPCYSVWERQYRDLSCAAVWEVNLLFPFYPHVHLWGRPKGMYQQVDHLRTLPLLSHHKTTMWSKISPLLFSW